MESMGTSSTESIGKTVIGSGEPELRPYLVGAVATNEMISKEFKIESLDEYLTTLREEYPNVLIGIDRRIAQKIFGVSICFDPKKYDTDEFLFWLEKVSLSHLSNGVVTLKRDQGEEGIPAQRSPSELGMLNLLVNPMSGLYGDEVLIDVIRRITNKLDAFKKGS